MKIVHIYINIRLSLNYGILIFTSWSECTFKHEHNRHPALFILAEGKKMGPNKVLWSLGCIPPHHVPRQILSHQNGLSYAISHRSKSTKTW